MNQTSDTVDQASVAQILDHLDRCDPSFVVELERRVDLRAYVRKLVDHATRLEAWNDGRLSGLVAMYANDRSTRIAFVTHVSVAMADQGRGTARRLMTRAVELAASSGMLRVDLEVASGRTGARRLYESLGFAEVRASDGTAIMSRSLKTGATP